MTWTLEKLETIPEVYRDFMMILKPVIDTRAPEAVLKITGVHFRTLYEMLFMGYDYEVTAVRQIAQILRQRGLINEDERGVFTPTDEGARLIVALAREGERVRQRVPPLPEI